MPWNFTVDDGPQSVFFRSCLLDKLQRSVSKLVPSPQASTAPVLPARLVVTLTFSELSTGAIRVPPLLGTSPETSHSGSQPRTTTRPGLPAEYGLSFDQLGGRSLTSLAQMHTTKPSTGQEYCCSWTFAHEPPLLTLSAVPLSAQA